MKRQLICLRSRRTMKRSNEHPELTARKQSTRSANRWNNSLFAAINDRSLIIAKKELVTIIKDKYPKSRHHFLVIPTKSSIDSISGLTPCDLELLEKMSSVATDLAQKTDKTIDFQFGFHTIPSLKPLHLHVISQDFDSECLKTKKHFNSFTTQFFINIETVIDDLRTAGKVRTLARDECQKLLKQDLVCHRCQTKLVNVPDLKRHLLTHFPK